MENLCYDNLCDVVMGFALTHTLKATKVDFHSMFSRDIVSAVKVTTTKTFFFYWRWCWLSIFHRQWYIAIKHDQYLFALNCMYEKKKENFSIDNLLLFVCIYVYNSKRKWMFDQVPLSENCQNENWIVFGKKI